MGRVHGDHYSSDSTVGSIIIIMYKLLVAAAVISVASCEAEADPGYFYGAYPALYNAYPNWPGVSTPYSSSTCYGCYGKRSADAEADPGYLYAPYHYGAYGCPAYGYRYGLAGVAGHPGAATSFVARSPQGLRGKRSADAEPGYLAYGYAPFVPVSYSTHGYGPSGYTIGQGHPGAASSFQSVSRLH